MSLAENIAELLPNTPFLSSDQIDMENTKFLRKYLNLVSYDKPYNSLPLFLLILLAFFGLSTVVMAALAEKDLDISLEAIKDVVSLSIVFFCITEHGIFPQRALKLVKLIEDEFIVNRDELFERSGHLWEEMGMLYERKKEDIRRKFQYLSWTLYLIFFGYSSKHFLNQLVGIETKSEENGLRRWPTPFRYPLPQFQSYSFFLYTYVTHLIMLAAVCTEGYFMLTTVTLSTEKVLADFETICLLLSYVTNEFPDSRPGNYEKMASQLVYRPNSIRSSRKDADLRVDMRRIVRCHQIINRNFKICADCSALVVIAAIAVNFNDSCSNAFFMLKSNDMKKAISFTFMFIMENLTLFFIYQNGQRIFNQNNVLRKYLAELPWTDKPQWFRQTVHIMMTRANVDNEMKPYGLFVLNYISFKDIMKFTFSVGNVLYTRKLRANHNS